MILAPLARTWLRRIALGLPLVAIAPASGCCFDPSAPGGIFRGVGIGDVDPERDFPPCPPPDPIDATFALTPEQLARIALPDGGTDLGQCSTLCYQLQIAAGGETRGGTSCTPVAGAEPPSIACHFENVCMGGRAPSGLRAACPTSAPTAIGAYLAAGAHLEAASVAAFGELARELRLHDAPRALVSGALRAARDEARHASAVAALARRQGALVPAVRREATEPRALPAIAEDNAREGCVREAHAALVAAHQAAHAADAHVRRAYAGIARDEARHALWSFALHDWSAARLGTRAARRIDETRRAAITSWRAQAEHEPSPALRDMLGLPDAGRAARYADALT